MVPSLYLPETLQYMLDKFTGSSEESDSSQPEDFVGKQIRNPPFTYTARDVVLYALGGAY